MFFQHLCVWQVTCTFLGIAINEVFNSNRSSIHFCKIRRKKKLFTRFCTGVYGKVILEGAFCRDCSQNIGK